MIIIQDDDVKELAAKVVEEMYKHSNDYDSRDAVEDILTEFLASVGAFPVSSVNPDLLETFEDIEKNLNRDRE